MNMTFENVYLTPRVRAALSRVLQPKQHRRFWQAVTKLKQGRFDIPGLNVEKLHTAKGKFYSARLSIHLRLVFSILKHADGTRQSLIIQDLDQHDPAYSRLSRIDARQHGLLLDSSAPRDLKARNLDEPKDQRQSRHSNEWQADSSLDLPDQPQDELSVSEFSPSNQADLTPGPLYRVPSFVLSNPEKFLAFERNIDRYLRLSDEQEQLLARLDLAYLVQGSAGTGKTTLALFYALHVYESDPNRTVYLFTYHDELACVCRSYKVCLTDEDDHAGAGIKVFSYLEFCRQYSMARESGSNQPDSDSTVWISRNESVAILEKIIAAKPRWARHYEPENFYSLIYSILKGRFVPGTERLPSDREDYRRIFKDYGNVPVDMDEILEVYVSYEKWLKRLNLRDEADLIRLAYERQKTDPAVNMPGWIVIDEIQDFTELEWKSILLLWERACKQTGGAASFPFVCGDVNQNISRSGFRWQELHSYIEGILRTLHRPNAVVKVQLHSNFRNTREIYDLAVLLRSLTGDPAADLGLRPEQRGSKPQLVTGAISDFLTFLEQLASSRNNCSSPLVILCENDDDLALLRQFSADNEAVFLLSMKSSKGMEFEDVIIYRPFSSIKDAHRLEVENGKLLDLWYMGVSRARKSLLLFVTDEDFTAFSRLAGDKSDEFLHLVDACAAPAGDQLMSFYQSREQSLPNYNVVFLERKVAEDMWNEYLRLTTDKCAQSTVSTMLPGNRSGQEGTCDLSDQHSRQADQDSIADDRACSAAAGNRNEDGDGAPAFAETCRDRALNLWRRCHDYANLGKALFYLKRYSEALIYLQRSGKKFEAAYCQEQIGRFAEAAELYIECGAPDQAARCYEYAGDYLKAASIYEARGNWVMAAESYASAGELEKAAAACVKAGRFGSAADFYKLRGDYSSAADCYGKAQDFSSAARMHIKAGQKAEAARSFEMAGKTEEAARLYEELQHWLKAAKLYERNSNFAKAGRLYAKAGELSQAGRVYELAGRSSAAARFYEKAGDWLRAAGLFLALNNKQRAAVCYRNGGILDKAGTLFAELQNFEEAGRSFEQAGKFDEACRYFLKADNLSAAAYCFERLGHLNEAADYYLKSKNNNAAAAVLAKAGRPGNAARLYLLSGQTQKAIELLGASGREDAAQLNQLLDWANQSKQMSAQAEILEHLGRHLEAAIRFQQCMMLPRAAQNFEKSSKFAEAAWCYTQEGKLEDAVRCYKKNNQWKQAARCLELLHKRDEAEKLYRRCNDSEGIARCRNAINWL